MFYKYNDSHILLFGRWGMEDNQCITTATGSKIVFTFTGNMAKLYFNTDDCECEYPHLWIKLDDTAMIESTVSAYIRVQSETYGNHRVEIIYKGGNEGQSRWFKPLIAKIAFKGFEADAIADTDYEKKPIIEIIGDSISEGILIDPFDMDAKNGGCASDRPYQDDVTATYHYLAAKELGLEPYVMGYGSLGFTSTGSGRVPPINRSYLYVYDGVKMVYPREPEYILINHGANDRRAPTDIYLSEYEKLLDTIYLYHPNAKVISLPAFCGCHHDELQSFIGKYNMSHNKNVFFIPTKGWVSKNPLHPLRGGHELIAKKLAEAMRERYGKENFLPKSQFFNVADILGSIDESEYQDFAELRSFLRKLPTPLWTNKAFFLEIMKKANKWDDKTWELLKEILPEKFAHDRTFLFECACMCAKAVTLSDDVKDDKNFTFEVISNNYKAYNYLSDELKKDPKLIQAFGWKNE